MAHDTLIDQIVTILQPYTARLRAEIIGAAPKAAKATERAWRNADGIILVYVSYDPNGKADEASVEAIYSLHVQETQVKFTADVENQDGEVLESIVNEVWLPVDDTTLSTIERLGQRAHERFLDFFQLFLESHQQ